MRNNTQCYSTTYIFRANPLGNVMKEAETAVQKLVGPTAGMKTAQIPTKLYWKASKTWT